MAKVTLGAFTFSTVLLCAQNFPPIESDMEIQATISFLTSAESSVGFVYNGTCGALSGKLLPLSYYSTADYWGKYVGTLPGNDLTVIDQYDSNTYTLTPIADPSSPGSDLQVERINVYNGTDIYDAACWQIALGVYAKAEAQPAYFDLAGNQNLLLSVGYDGNGDTPSENANRATTQGDGTFSYNGESITTPANAYFFRMVTRNWLSTDPIYGTPYGSSISVRGTLPSNYHVGQVTWMDWKPITGENAWGFLVGPLHLARLNESAGKQTYVPFASNAVQNAIGVLNALAAMQSPLGAIYYACAGSIGNQGTNPVDPFEISVENNASALSGLLLMQKILQEEVQNEADLSPDQKGQIQTALKMIDTMIHGGTTPQGVQTQGILSFFKSSAWDATSRTFLQGGLANKPNEPAWQPTIEPKAVDVTTWGISVLGQPQVDEWFGFGACYNAWQSIKSWGGYYGPDGTIWGVGYSDQDGNGNGGNYQNGIISAEWTAGAINLLRCLITQYGEAALSSNYSPAQQAFAKQSAIDLQADHDQMFKQLMTLRSDHYFSTAAYDSVRPQDYTSLIPIPQGKLAFVYASKRYMIPFGWFANPLPSTTSTSWTVMLHYNFNPFHPDGSYESSFPVSGGTPLVTQLNNEIIQN